MRRFSQKNALVTLSDINVTPLLDLAFVLLIIFVITTPLLESNLDLKLPSGGSSQEAPLERKDIKTVEIDSAGGYVLAGQRLRLDQVETALAAEAQRNPRMVVDIRADKQTAWEHVVALLDRCQKRGITRFRPVTAPQR